jgi:hypothetical protein
MSGAREQRRSHEDSGYSQNIPEMHDGFLGE